MRPLLLLLGVFAVVQTFAAQSPEYAAAADWVHLRDPIVVEAPEDYGRYGYDYLLVDQQVNVAEEATFYRLVYRVTSESSLQSAARLSWTYDPHYETLAIHHVRVLRDGAVQDRLKPDTVQVLQQERDLDRHLLNGDLTALLLLDDIRVGDVIDYATTRKGWNPTFGGKFSHSVVSGWGVPVREQHFSVRIPADRSLSFKTHGDWPLTFAASREGEDSVMTWQGSDVPMVNADADLPKWFEYAPVLRLSEYGSWADVVNWARPLYDVPEPLADELVAKAEELTRGLETDGEKTVALLQFVQQEVRYLGMELGAGSFRPRPPHEVLTRRFGDCKDKTLLFCTLMRAVGLTAYPALVETDYKRHIASHLPSPKSFDHVIAAIPQESGWVWADPTIMYQAGQMEYRGHPNYERALIIRDGSTELTPMEILETASRSVLIEEVFDISAFDAPAKFRVKSAYTGLSADYMRQYLAETSLEKIEKSYVNFYSSAYPGISMTKSVTWTDDLRQNRLVVDEEYDVPDLWQDTSEERKIKAEFYPKGIQEYAVRTDHPVRTMPLQVQHPRKAELITTVNLPEVWSVNAGEEVFESKAFRATSGISGEGRQVTMRYTWTSLADHVLPVDVPEHVKAVQNFRNGLGYTLTYRHPAPAATTAPDVTPEKAPEPAPSQAVTTQSTPSTKPPSDTNWLFVILLGVVAIAAIAGAVAIWRWRPDAPPYLVKNTSLAGLGGWLVLVGFGVVLGPILVVVQLATQNHGALDIDVWNALTTPGSPSYRSGLGLLLVLEYVGNIVLLTLTLLLVPLFFAKKRVFPRVYITATFFTLIFLSSDLWAAGHWVHPGTPVTFEQAKPVIQSFMRALVWVPYMLFSKRVRATFVR